VSWEKSSYTKAGAALLSESLSGGAVTITRAVSGTGTVDTDLSEETGIVLLNLGLDQLHQRLHLRVYGEGQAGFG